MIVTFIHTPRGNGIYEAIYQSLKFQNPQCDFFYACKDFKTGKPKGVFCEDVLERVDFHIQTREKLRLIKKNLEAQREKVKDLIAGDNKAKAENDAMARNPNYAFGREGQWAEARKRDNIETIIDTKSSLQKQKID